MIRQYANQRMEPPLRPLVQYLGRCRQLLPRADYIVQLIF